ncbi:MAG: porin family protein [Xanthomonadales bacterium]|nr:porin family protein [Xanthomonadales bacterium]
MLKRITFILLLLANGTTVVAQYDNQKRDRESSAFGSRDGRFESSAVMALQNGAEKEFEGGSTLDIDSELGWGFSLGWNWTQNLNLSYRLLSTKPNYTATLVIDGDSPDPLSIEHEMSKYSHQFNLTYNFMDGSFTPFIVAGIGVASVDSNVPTGALEGACWWDPWWGYICYTDWKSYTSTELAYNLGLGFRWDINTALFTRGSYSVEYIDLDSGTLDFGTFIFELGLMF